MHATHLNFFPRAAGFALPTSSTVSLQLHLSTSIHLQVLDRTLFEFDGVTLPHDPQTHNLADGLGFFEAR